jgi:hypothetical protein
LPALTSPHDSKEFAMTAIRFIRAATLAAAGLFAATLPAASAPAAPPDTAAETTLHAGFRIAARQEWVTITIDLAPSAWRAGDANGRPVSPAEMQSMLARLRSVEVGGSCIGWVEGATSYPCGFAVEWLGAAGTGTPTFSARAVGWETSAAGRARTAGRSTPELTAAGLISPLPDDAQFVAVKVPPALLGAPGSQRITFRIRAVSNPLVPSIFERDSGQIILRMGPVAGGAPA